MVRQKKIALWAALFVLLLPLAAWCKEPRIRVLVDENGVPVNEAFTAQIEITVQQEEEVDANSFALDDEALEVQLVSKQSGYSSTLINGQLTEEHKATYKFRFAMPPKEVGIHVIPPISVTINGQRFSTQATTYRVVEPLTIPEFTLEAAIEGKTPVFPGQELELVYSLRAPANISLDREYLPLLQAEGFRLLGDRVRQSDRPNGGHHWVIRQKVLALSPGTYRFGPSYFEGFLVKRSFFGGTQAISDRLRASAPVVSIVVNPFPSNGQPAWFDGALGSFRITAQLLSPSKLGVGDRVLVQVNIEGDGELSTVKAPKLAEQPGFESFRIGDLQGVGKELGQRKEFTLELRPLDSSVSAIPPINFAFYEPDSGRYQSVATPAIPLTVEALQQLPAFQGRETTRETDQDPNPSPEANPEAKPEIVLGGRIPIAGAMPIAFSDLSTNKHELSSILLAVVAALVCLVLQVLAKQRISASAAARPIKRAKDWLAEAYAASEEDHAYATPIEKALTTRLLETKHCTSLPRSARDIQEEGLAGRVRAYLLHLEAQRYAGKHGLSKQRMLQEAQELYDQL